MINEDKIHLSWMKKMNRQKRYYPPEFKREALEMFATGEYIMAQLGYTEDSN